MTEPESKPSDQRSYKRLVRIREGKMIAGVCTGIGAYFNMDATIVRLLWIILILAGGAGVLLYLLAWIIMPLENRA